MSWTFFWFLWNTFHILLLCSIPHILAVDIGCNVKLEPWWFGVFAVLWNCICSPICAWSLLFYFDVSCLEQFYYCGKKLVFYCALNNLENRFYRLQNCCLLGELATYFDLHLELGLCRRNVISGTLTIWCICCPVNTSLCLELSIYFDAPSIFVHQTFSNSITVVRKWAFGALVNLCSPVN